MGRAIVNRSPGIDGAPVSTAPRRRLARAWAVVLAAVVVAGLVAGWRGFHRAADPDRLWADAERAFLAGHRDRARAALATLARLRPTTGLDRLLAAQVATADGRFDDALAEIGQISDAHPMAAQALLLAGRIERQRRRIRKAETAFRRALAIKPGLVDARKELIYILGIQSRRREVDAEFRALARQTTLTHHDLFTWALTHFTHWNPDIVEDLDGFIKADPEDRDSRLAVVELLLERPEVESYIARILDPLPATDGDARALRIELAFNLGRYDEAERLLAAAPEDHPRIARLRGAMALQRRDLDAAIRHFRAALSAEPYDRVSPMHLAQALRLKGDIAAAESLMDRVRKLNHLYNLIVRVRSPRRENRASDLAELGNACADAGLVDEARGWYSLAIGVNPLDGAAQQALHRLGRP